MRSVNHWVWVTCYMWANQKLTLFWRWERTFDRWTWRKKVEDAFARDFLSICVEWPLIWGLVVIRNFHVQLWSEWLINDGQRRNEVHDLLDMEQLLGNQTNQSTLEKKNVYSICSNQGQTTWIQYVLWSCKFWSNSWNLQNHCGCWVGNQTSMNFKEEYRVCSTCRNQALKTWSKVRQCEFDCVLPRRKSWNNCLDMELIITHTLALRWKSELSGIKLWRLGARSDQMNPICFGNF